MTKLMTCALGALLSGCLSLAPVSLGSDERKQADVAPDAAGDAAGAGMPTTIGDARADSATSDAGTDGGDEADEADETDETDEADEGTEQGVDGSDEETMDPAPA